MQVFGDLGLNCLCIRSSRMRWINDRSPSRSTNAAVDPLQSVDYEEFEDMMITTRKIAALVGKSNLGE